MPYIIVRGNLASYGSRQPFRVLVSGLTGGEIEQLKHFPCGGYSDESTIVYLCHPCTILSALEIHDFRVIASSSTSVKQDYNEYMWTMTKELDSACDKTAVNSKLMEPVSKFYYVSVKGSHYAKESQVFGLEESEVTALDKRCQKFGDVVNGHMFRTPPHILINNLAEIGYRVICSSGEAEITWTLGREV